MLKKIGWTTMLTTTALAAAVAIAQEQLPTGAASAWTSDDAIVLAARRMIDQGQYKQADELLRRNEDAKVPARAELVELIRRIRLDYTLTVDDFLTKLHKSIPDATAADVERWAKANELTVKTIDGQMMIFKSEPSNLFKLSKEARERRVNFTPKAEFALPQHIEKILAAAQSSGERYVLPTRHQITYSVTVPGHTAGMKSGSLLRVWLPYPQEFARQRDVRLIEAIPSNVLIAPSKDETQRTAYFEKKIDDPTKDSTFTIKFEFTGYADCPRLDDAAVKPLPADFPQHYLAERPPHIVFSPTVRQIVKDVVGDETNPLVKARKLWDWHNANIRYAYEDEYCTIPSISAKCLRLHKGDCGVQSITFITLARCAGIPARWQSGWQLKPGDINMHDWSEIYVEPWGWIVVDPSYGKQKSDAPLVRDYYLGHQDNYRMVVNFDYGRELYPPKPSLRSEPADFQRGEVELDGQNLYYDQWDYNIDVKSTPADGK